MSFFFYLTVDVDKFRSTPHVKGTEGQEIIKRTIITVVFNLIISCLFERESCKIKGTLRPIYVKRISKKELEIAITLRKMLILY